MIPPYTVLTVGLRNGLAPTLVVGLEIVTPPVRVPGSAGTLGLWRVTRKLLSTHYTHHSERSLGGGNGHAQCSPVWK